MNKLNGVLASVGAACLIAGAAVAADETMVETYAHPTMFSQAAQVSVNADKEYVVGGKIVKAANRIGIKNKKNVAIQTWANAVLDTIKDNTTDKYWNPKMPILRSELAVVLAEGLNLQTTAPAKYTDIADKYWASAWINKALAAKVMIGYPDNTFRPDQPVTKAEVFATLATLMNVPFDGKATPEFKGNAVQYIPNWAVPATNEVIASTVLDTVPSQSKVVKDEYLSKEQVAYLVGNLRLLLAKAGYSNCACAGAYTPTAIKVKLLERLSAKTSNIGDKFNVKTTENVVLSGQSFPAGSTVKGEVVEVARPGIKNPGYIRVKFTEIQNGDAKLAFPSNMTEAEVAQLKNPNIVARIFGAPFSAAARVAGVAGRTAAAGAKVTANSVEQFGEQLSDGFVNTLTLHPGSGAKSLGGSVITVAKGVFNLCELAVSGVVGVVYEFADEAVYMVVPCLSNDAALNPNEELLIVY